MSFEVQLTEDATQDLEEIYDYIRDYDAPGKADYVLQHLETAIHDLATSPERGSYPKELLPPT